MTIKQTDLPVLLSCPNCKKSAVYYITSTDMDESVIQCACRPLSMRSLYHTEEELGNMWNSMPRVTPIDTSKTFVDVDSDMPTKWITEEDKTTQMSVNKLYTRIKN